MSTLTKDDLAHFTGSEVWYRHNLMPSVTYTQGVQYLAERGGAYWLLDKIATSQLIPAIRAEQFQSWRLTVNPDTSATLEVEDGNGNVLHSEFIHFTDFPLPDITVWCVDRVMLLPSEY
jgi:hypothetical protein